MNVALLWLTKLYLRSVGGKFTRIQTIKLLNEKQQEIIVFSGDNPPLLGQRTLFGTTIVHESAFSTERLLNYVVIHETGHKKQWYGYFIYPLAVVCVLASLSFLFAAIWALLDSIISLDPAYLLGTLWGLFLAVLSLVILAIYSWLLELNAEFYAIGKLGLQVFLDAKADAPKPHKRTFYLWAIILMTHPPSCVTIRIYHWIHRKPQ